MSKTTKSLGSLSSMGRYVTLDEDVLPEMKDWQTGEEYSITLKVKMVSKSQGDMYGDSDDDDTEGRFKIISATAPSNKRSDKLEVMKDRLKK